MRLTSREEIDVPLAFAYAQLSDPAGWEQVALRRGVDLRRLGPQPGQGAGPVWAVGFVWRGKRREATFALTACDPPSRLAFAGTGGALDAVLAVDLTEIGPCRTRIVTRADLRPRTLVARMLVQSLRLARERVEAQFRGRTAQVGAEIAARFAALP